MSTGKFPRCFPFQHYRPGNIAFGSRCEPCLPLRNMTRGDVHGRYDALHVLPASWNGFELRSFYCGRHCSGSWGRVSLSVGQTVTCSGCQFLEPNKAYAETHLLACLLAFGISLT